MPRFTQTIINEMKKMVDDGIEIKKIAYKMGVKESTVLKYLKMTRAEIEIKQFKGVNVRCEHCNKIFKIDYSPRLSPREWAEQKCLHCNKKII